MLDAWANPRVAAIASTRGYPMYSRSTGITPKHVMPLSLRRLSIPPNGANFIQKRTSRYTRDALLVMPTLKNEFLEVALTFNL